MAHGVTFSSVVSKKLKKMKKVMAIWRKGTKKKVEVKLNANLNSVSFDGYSINYFPQ